uniref:Uncharacterized protein n=1 Tax=Anguilla anguilla TaxID=7936 RepID=A0A0E9U407_ANGAN
MKSRVLTPSANNARHY